MCVRALVSMSPPVRTRRATNTWVGADWVQDQPRRVHFELGRLRGVYLQLSRAVWVVPEGRWYAGSRSVSAAVDVFAWNCAHPPAGCPDQMVLVAVRECEATHCPVNVCQGDGESYSYDDDTGVCGAATMASCAAKLSRCGCLHSNAMLAQTHCRACAAA